jgi:hypothetical protein
LKKNIICVLVLLTIFTFSGCTDNDKSTITFTHSAVGSMPSHWEYEYFPNGYIYLIKMDETLSSKIFSIVGGGIYYYKFKAITNGEFSICWVYYELGDWLQMDKSYVADFVINEDFEIQQVGEKRPIYEVEKYDRYLFEQFTNQYKLHIDHVLDDYPDITYSATSYYENRTVEITVYSANSDDESELEKIIEDYLNERFQNLNEVMHDTTINITFADSDITNDSETD